jgi:hypothetical protein
MPSSPSHTGKPLIDGPKPTPPTIAASSAMCGAAQLLDDAVRRAHKLPKIQPAFNFDGIHSKLEALARFSFRYCEDSHGG